MTDVDGISIVIPNFNGERLLADNLPSVIAALKQWGGKSELIVVDDCSSDGSRTLIAERFPQVKLMANSSNQGFSKTCNRGMAAAQYPVAFCINNDVKVTDGFIGPVLRHFEDPSVFAVTPNIVAEREGKNQGVVVGAFGKGFIRGGFAPMGESGGERDNLYAIGACAAYDMGKFRALGGYGEIYSPYLFEDVDISYRGWKRGWRSVYEPGAMVYHYSSATIGKTKKRLKRQIYFRNRFLFHWINLTDPAFLFRNLFHTAVRLASSFLWLDFAYYASFFGALRRLGDALQMRRSVVGNLRLGDREILARTGKLSP